MYFEVCCLTFPSVKALAFMKVHLFFPTVSVFLYLSLQTYLEVSWRTVSATTQCFCHFALACFEDLESLNDPGFNSKASELYQYTIKMVTTFYTARSPPEWKFLGKIPWEKNTFTIDVAWPYKSQWWSQAEFGCFTPFCKAWRSMLLVNEVEGPTALAFPNTSLSSRAGSAVPS